MGKTKLTAEEVKHIAKLSNLTLSDEEVVKFQDQLSSTLDYIEDLNEINTDGLEAKNQVNGLVNIESEDIPEPSLTEEEVFKNAKQKSQNSLFKVKAIF